MTSREAAIQEGFALLRAGQTLSLDSVARRVGLTKPGLMHHFPTKEALMLALVDAVVDRWESGLDAALPADATPRQRALVYLEWCLSPEIDSADLVMMADPRLRAPLTARWTARFEPWFAADRTASADERGRIAAVRLLADGAWFAAASAVMPPAADELDTIRSAARAILGVG